jgi:hypothetical protein
MGGVREPEDGRLMGSDADGNRWVGEVQLQWMGSWVEVG